jgi:dihydrolipoamide dehydrogenase
LGGFYLNAGCVASMALLESSKIYHTLNHELTKHGIQAENVSLNIPQMIQRKNDSIDALRDNIADLFARHKIDRIHATGRLLNERPVEVIRMPFKTVHR